MNDFISPFAIEELLVVDAELHMQDTPSENMEFHLNCSLIDEYLGYDNRNERYELEQELLVAAKLLNRDDDSDERFYVSATVHLAAYCLADKDAPNVVKFIRGSGISVAYGHARTFICSVTGMTALGQFVIPSVDPTALLEKLDEIEVVDALV